MMKIKTGMIVGAWVMAAALATGCQSTPINASSNAAIVQNKVAIKANLVHSHHLGVDEHGRAYLLLVLNDQGVNLLNQVAQRDEPYDIVFGGKSYTQTAQVNSGFLVLTPVDVTWTERDVATWLQ